MFNDLIAMTVLGVCILTLVVLIYGRIKDKGREDFEDRNN